MHHSKDLSINHPIHSLKTNPNSRRPFYITIDEQAKGIYQKYSLEVFGNEERKKMVNICVISSCW
jgi:hypothetical protein